MSAASISLVNQLIAKNLPEISRNADLPNITVGETIQTSVLGKLADNKYLLALKNLQIPATSTIPLQPGEKLSVKVGSLQPQIILNIIDNQTQNTDIKINEKLLFWRLNPDSLVQVLNKAADLANILQNGNLPAKISLNDIQKLLKLFEGIIFSAKTKDNPLFLKDFISKTGMLLENELGKLVSESANGTLEKPLTDNIKVLLLKLSEQIQGLLQEDANSDASVKAKLLNMMTFTDEALKTIEAKQTINTVFQESDNGLVLQVPFAFPDKLRLADIFIQPEDKNSRKDKFSSCKVVIFLDMDILGKIAVNAGLREGNFSCVIKCENDDVKNLICAAMENLKKAISSIGYKVDNIDCIQECELDQVRQEFIEKQSFTAIDLINYFA